MSSNLRKPLSKNIDLDGKTLNLEKLSCLASGDYKIVLNEKTISTINNSRKIVDSIIKDSEPVYGFNTGFGLFSNIAINNDHIEDLQYNLIRSHAAGTGNLVNIDQTLRTAVLRVNTLVRGHSGISYETLNTLIKMINSNIVSYMPSQGTVGASGDLIPLAHIALGVIGEGLLYNPRSKKYEEASKVLKEFNISPAILKAREGLAFINGTQFMTGIGSVALENSINLIRAVNAISGLSFTALKGHPTEFDVRIGEIRPHPGQITIADIMRRLIPVGSILVNQRDLQSPYSLRCIPQVHGPVLEMILYVKQVLETEMNSTTDNPLCFDYGEPRIISNGNFHGEYIAKAMDVLAIYIHELGNISYPRIMRLLNRTKNHDLNTFLTYEEGLSSGLMVYENLAAALVSENKVHCSPASVDSLSTCADKEDHVSMGGYAARKAVTVSENVGKILAVELLSATKAIYMRKEKEKDFKIPKNLQKIYDKVMTISPPLITDRYLIPEYEKLYEYIMSGKLWDEVLDEIENDFTPSSNDYTCKKSDYKVSNRSCSLPNVPKATLSPLPLNESNNLLYTKIRSNQVQFGERSDFFIKAQEFITLDYMIEKLKAKKNGKDLYALFDLSQNDIGSRANFGRGHSSDLLPFKPFLEKISNHPINRLNESIFQSLYILGSLDLSDIVSNCKNLLPNETEDRKKLIQAVTEIDKRTQAVCDAILETQSRIICLNGDNDVTYSLISSVKKAFNKKVVVIYLDIHSDARDPNDGPHSGTWLSRSYKENLIEHSYLIGFSELHNNDVCVDNLIKNKVEYLDYTCQNIQSGEITLKSSAEEIVKSVQSKYKDNPIVFCIDGDSVSGLPASAENFVVGFPHFEVYKVIYTISKYLNIHAFNIAELKPSLDESRANAVGEFLVQSLYIFLKSCLKEEKMSKL